MFNYWFMLSISLFINVFAIIPNGQASEVYSKYQLEIFDDSVRKLPYGYLGLDPKGLSEQVQKISIKGEYQTTREYRAMLKKPFYGDLTINSLMAVSLPAGSNAIFDADNKRLIFRTYISYHSSPEYIDIRGDGLHGFTSFELMKEKTIDDIYQGSNSFGASRPFHSITYFTYDMFAVNRKKLGIKSLDVIFRLNMTGQEARVFKETISNVRILIVFKLAKPYVASSSEYHIATYSKPDQIAIFHQYMIAKIKSLWLYNDKSGTIFKKVIINK